MLVDGRLHSEHSAMSKSLALPCNRYQNCARLNLGQMAFSQSSLRYKLIRRNNLPIIDLGTCEPWIGSAIPVFARCLLRSRSVPDPPQRSESDNFPTLRH